MITPRTHALDFDDTFTADPELWAMFVLQGRRRGHKFYMVTARRETKENLATINGMLDEHRCQMEIIFTALGSKLEAVKKRNITIDIWHDDDPVSLVRGH